MRPYRRSLLLSPAEKWGTTAKLFIRITGFLGSKQGMARLGSSRQMHKTIKTSGG